MTEEVVNKKTKEEDAIPDGKGNVIIPLDFSTEDTIKAYQAYMIMNNYSKPSVDHFYSILEEGEVSVELAMGKAVLNEIILNALNSAIQKDKEAKENEQKSEEV